MEITKNKENTLKRKQITKIITKLLETNIEIMTFYKHMAVDDKSKRVCTKSIKQSKLAIEKLQHVNHLEILVSIYNALISGKEFVFVSGASLICSKNFDYWDKTEEGFKKFMELEKEAKEEHEQKIKEQEQEKEAIAKAKEDGKEIENVLVDGKIQTVVKE